MEVDEEGIGKPNKRSTSSIILKSVLVTIFFFFLSNCEVVREYRPPAVTSALDDDDEELAFEARIKVFEDEDTPLRRARAMKALRGLERFNRSLALLRDELPVMDEEDEEEPFKKAGEVSIRGCSS